MQKTKVKFIFSFIMMFIAYNGLAQNEKNSGNRKVATFSNGDEAIRITAKTNKNMIKLTTTDDYNKYDILELSNHEVIHRKSKSRKLDETQSDGYYMVEGSEIDPEIENEIEDTSGA